jgi:hypothetical protein
MGPLRFQILKGFLIIKFETSTFSIPGGKGAKQNDHEKELANAFMPRQQVLSNLYHSSDCPGNAGSNGFRRSIALLE